jgi:hypothetical protein
MASRWTSRNESRQRTSSSWEEPPPLNEEFRDLVITGLAHLVSANSECGFKQCLRLAYDPDARNFAHVFARVIGQSTGFDPGEKSLAKARNAALCEVHF